MGGEVRKIKMSVDDAYAQEPSRATSMEVPQQFHHIMRDNPKNQISGTS
jgi:hypothetical protein